MNLPDIASLAQKLIPIYWLISKPVILATFLIFYGGGVVLILLHEIAINSPIGNVYHAAKDFDLSKSKIIKFLFKIRGLPTKRLNLQNFIGDIGFTNLEENYPYENLIGFWVILGHHKTV